MQPYTHQAQQTEAQQDCCSPNMAIAHGEVNEIAHKFFGELHNIKLSISVYCIWASFSCAETAD